MILLKKAGLVVILSVIAWCVLHPFRELELGWLYWLRTDRPISDKIWIVSIDEELEKTNKPIPHSRYAQLIETLFDRLLRNAKSATTAYHIWWTTVSLTQHIAYLSCQILIP